MKTNATISRYLIKGYLLLGSKGRDVIGQGGWEGNRLRLPRATTRH